MKAHFLDTGHAISAESLAAEGVHYERLSTAEVAYRPAVDALKETRGYVEEDVVALSPQTPGLSELCAKFVDEHYHDEDEVRFVLEGDGIFDIRSKRDDWMRIAVEAGDLIVVPARRFHRFLLTEARSIRCVRLFQDAAGWEPHYRS